MPAACDASEALVFGALSLAIIDPRELPKGLSDSAKSVRGYKINVSSKICQICSKVADRKSVV